VGPTPIGRFIDSQLEVIFTTQAKLLNQKREPEGREDRAKEGD
jgi:hypothetical protein